MAEKKKKRKKYKPIKKKTNERGLYTVHISKTKPWTLKDIIQHIIYTIYRMEFYK